MELYYNDVIKKYGLSDEIDRRCREKSIGRSEIYWANKIICDVLNEEWTKYKKEKEELQKKVCHYMGADTCTEMMESKMCWFVRNKNGKQACLAQCEIKEKLELIERVMDELQQASDQALKAKQKEDLGT